MKFILAALVAALFAMPAFAQSVCVKNENLPPLVEKLKAEIAFSGLVKSGTKYLIFVNQETGYWLAVKQGGELSCVLVEGENFGITVGKPK